MIVRWGPAAPFPNTGREGWQGPPNTSFDLDGRSVLIDPQSGAYRVFESDIIFRSGFTGSLLGELRL